MKLLTVEQIARVCHDVNQQYCLALGDKSQLPWDQAPQWQRDSAIKGVEFHLVNEHSTPADSHNAWLAEKLRTGWRYGTVKDEIRQEHPCICPYEQLPAQQQAKDYIFRQIVKSMKAIDLNKSEVAPEEALAMVLRNMPQPTVQMTEEQPGVDPSELE